jgi:hypothetical protein
MSTTKVTLSMPQEVNDRMRRFPDTNWSALFREALEHELRIREAIADNDRAAALRAKALADCEDVRVAGIEDAVTYPIEEIDYRFLRRLEELGRDYIECADPENLIDVFDNLNWSFKKDRTAAFRLRFPKSWDYKLGFIDGLLQLKAIADGPATVEKRRPTRPLSGDRAKAVMDKIDLSPAKEPKKSLFEDRSVPKSAD